MHQDWDKFWHAAKDDENLLGRFLSFYRSQVIARAVNYYINKFFEPDGVFIECGAGTSETTLKTKKEQRKFVALDYSEFILKKTITNPKIDDCINADIFSLPIKDNSADGIWNVGVMEHFTTEQIERILRQEKKK